MKAYRLTHDQCKARDLFSQRSLFTVCENRFDFGLIRHTKQNANRMHAIARCSTTWIGSHSNYQSRIKRRWPVRFFLAHGFVQDVWEPLKRILVGDPYRAQRLRLLEPQQIALEEAVRAVIGVIPDGRGDVYDRLLEALPNDQDLARRVDVSLGLSKGLLIRTKREYHDACANLVPRPGHGTLTIFEYPEMDLISTLHSEIQRILSRISRDATELAMKSFSIVNTVESDKVTM